MIAERHFLLCQLDATGWGCLPRSTLTTTRSHTNIHKRNVSKLLFIANNVRAAPAWKPKCSAALAPFPPSLERYSGKVPPSQRPSPSRPPPGSPSERPGPESGGVSGRRLRAAHLGAWPITIEDAAGGRQAATYLLDVLTRWSFLKRSASQFNRCRFPPKIKGRKVKEAGWAFSGGTAQWGPSVIGLHGQPLWGPLSLWQVRDPQGALLAPDHLLPLAQVIPGTRKAETGAISEKASGLCPTPPTV